MSHLPGAQPMGGRNWMGGCMWGGEVRKPLGRRGRPRTRTPHMNIRLPSDTAQASDGLGSSTTITQFTLCPHSTCSMHRESKSCIHCRELCSSLSFPNNPSLVCQPKAVSRQPSARQSAISHQPTAQDHTAWMMRDVRRVKIERIVLSEHAPRRLGCKKLRVQAFGIMDDFPTQRAR